MSRHLPTNGVGQSAVPVTNRTSGGAPLLFGGADLGWPVPSGQFPAGFCARCGVVFDDLGLGPDPYPPPGTICIGCHTPDEFAQWMRGTS